MQHNATYALSSGAPKPCTVSLFKNKLQILLLSDNGEPRTLYWYYDQMVKDEESDFVFAHLSHPPQMIAVQEDAVARQLAKRLHQHEKGVLTRGQTMLLQVFGSFILFLLLAYFVLLPWIAAGFAKRFPISYEKDMGEQLYQSMKGSFTVDEEKTVYINEFYQQQHFPSAYDIQIIVIKSDVANAFAMPGGRIVVHDKILQGMTAYPELAALLAHEMTHVEGRHSLKSLFRQLSGRLFLSMMIGDASAIGGILVSNADHLKTLSYSRSLEKEADEQGAQLLVQRNIDCNGFIHLFQLLQKESGAEVSEWVSSHPNLDKRIKNIQQNKACRTQQAANDSTLHQLFLKLKTAD